MSDFLFENVAKYATGQPQQLEWGRTLDDVLRRAGAITSQDIAIAANIWRGSTETTVDMGDTLLKGAKPGVMATPVKIVVSKSQAEKVFGNPVFDNELVDLNKCLQKFQIEKTKARICFFLAQIGHESGGLRWLKELASGEDYEGRTDLGNTQPGDGRRFKGGGVGQITGRSNYQAFANFIGDPQVMEGADYVASNYPFTSFGFWWQMNNINACVDAGEDMYQISGRVNCGSPNCKANGMDDRLDYYYRAVTAVV